MAGTYSTPAIVLRARPLGEKDRVLTLLSPEHGKFSASARGARNPRSKVAAVSQPFIFAKFLIAHGRSLDIVTQAQIEDAHLHIVGHLLKSAWATYLCELCDAMPEALPDEELFELLRVALSTLDDVEDSSAVIEIVGAWFEAHFLAQSGYAPTLGRCVACGVKISVLAEETMQPVEYSAQLGGTLCASCAPRDPARLSVSVQALRVLRRLERAAAPPAVELLDEWQITKRVRRELRACLRRSLATHLEIRLRSQRFLDDLLETME